MKATLSGFEWGLPAVSMKVDCSSTTTTPSLSDATGRAPVVVLVHAASKISSTPFSTICGMNVRLIATPHGRGSVTKFHM
jgi:hypothetical protein